MLACDKNGGSTADTAAGTVGNETTLFGGNHDSKGGNVLFCDGSVQWINAKTADWTSNIWGTVKMADAAAQAMY
jgi:prepilin-type processing-associated H-X9-DG protein